VTRREELLPEIRRLRDVEGLMWREIGARLGLSKATAHAYYSDPTGDVARARKAKKNGRCVDCRAETKASGAAVPPERCRTCNAAHVRAQSRRWILDSFAEWHRIFGVPPTAVEWAPAQARLRMRRGEYGSQPLARYESTGRPWPVPSLVADHFGSWNEGLRAAGFEPLTLSERPLGRRAAELRRSDEVAA
jgi:hypothetical protein